MTTLGIEALAASRRLRGLKVGVVSHAAAVASDFRHSVELVTEAGATVVALFGPQHGFQADVQDNMIETAHGRDPSTGLPVYSLYSETREPTPDMLAGLDALVIDLVDVGTRVYTFVYTMANCFRAARRHGIRVIVCDRPNPIGGVAIEGARLLPGYESFVGQFPLPMRHGLTIGELARLFNEQFGVGGTLEVQAMQDWTRGAYFDQTGLPWIMPSPNMPTLDTAIVYPGTVLFEGTNLSEGRGTTRPFELVGAPWINGRALADAMNAHGMPGVHFRPVVFRPTFQKHAGLTCGGVQVHVTDRQRFRPVRAGVTLLAECARLDRAAFRWRDPPYEYEREKLPIDILWGSDRLRRAIEDETPPAAFADSWRADERAFEELRRPYLLY